MKTLAILAFFSLAILAEAQTNIDYKALYEADESKIQRMKDQDAIALVLAKLHDIRLHTHPFQRQIAALKKVSVANCPPDFQTAWKAYLDESESNFQKRAHEEGPLIIENVAGDAMGFEDWVIKRDIIAAATAKQIPEPHSARAELLKVINNYGFK